MSRLQLWQEETTSTDSWESAHSFRARVREWAQTIGVQPARVQIQCMTRKWASCSPRGVLTFSSELLDQPRDVGEAVIVHELVHLKVPNHGPVFKSLMRAYVPDVRTDALLDCAARGRA